MAPGLEGAADQVAEAPEGDALEELNARARAATLRTMGQALGAMVLATGNKSELSVGAGVLGGDMTGDFAPLRDCPKTLLYELVRWRNRAEGKEDLPDDVLDRTPSVRERDELTLPSYRVLDEIVERIIEGAEGVEDIVAAGFERQTVQDVLQADHRQRAQAADGLARGEDHRARVGQGPAHAGDQRLAAVRARQAARARRVNQRMLMWMLVLFFGGTVLFGGLRNATEDSSTGVIVAVQVGALALVIVVLVLVVRRLR